MSLILNSDQLERLAEALNRMSKIRTDLTVELAVYGPIHVAVDGQAIQVNWDKDGEQYVVDDVVGA